MRNQNPAKPGASSLSLRKKLVFSVLVVAGFFLVLEFVLLLAGVKPIADSKDPFVGFSGSLPLFVEEQGDDAAGIQARIDRLAGRLWQLDDDQLAAIHGELELDRRGGPARCGALATGVHTVPDDQ